MNYLPSGSPYRDYKEYLNGSAPATEDRFLDYGQSWTSLFLSLDARHYFPHSFKKDKGIPVYFGLRYILTGKSFETVEETRSSWGLFSPGTSTTYLTRYRITHRMGLVLGAQSVLGKKEHFLFGAEGGFGPMFNYNFSHVEMTPFFSFRFGVVLGWF